MSCWCGIPIVLQPLLDSPSGRTAFDVWIAGDNPAILIAKRPWVPLQTFLCLVRVWCFGRRFSRSRRWLETIFVLHSQALRKCSLTLQLSRIVIDISREIRRTVRKETLLKHSSGGYSWEKVTVLCFDFAIFVPDNYMIHVLPFFSGNALWPLKALGGILK